MTRERQTLRIRVTGERGEWNERGVSGDLRWTRIAATRCVGLCVGREERVERPRGGAYSDTVMRRPRREGFDDDDESVPCRVEEWGASTTVCVVAAGAAQREWTLFLILSLRNWHLCVRY